MDNAEWVGEAPSTESEWEGEGPEQSGSQWLGDAPKHNWGTQDARDLRKNKITAPEALSRGASQFVPSLVESANYPGLGAMSLWDKAASALGGKDTTAATDWYAKNFMEPSHKIIEANQLQPGESYSGLGAEVAHKVPAAAGKLAGEIIPSLVPAGAATATIQKSLQFTIPSLTKALGAELTPTVMAGTPMATKTATETYDRLKEAGVPEHRAVLAATADGLATYLQLATPMSVKGNMAMRAVTGAGVGYTGAKAQTNLVNAIVNDYSDAQIHRTTGDDLVAVVLGGTLSAGLGKKGEPKTAKPIEQEIKNDSRNIVENLNNIDPNRGIDTSGVKGPYFNPDAEIPPDGTRLLRKNDLTPTNVKTANIYNDRMAETGGEQIPGVSSLGEKVTNEKDLSRPYWPDQDLQDAIRDANIEQGDQGPNPYIPQDKLAEAQRWADKGQPAFGQMEIPQEAGNVPTWPNPELQKAMAQADRRANAIDNLPGTADVELGGKSPYMSVEELGKAQDQVNRTDEPAHSEMEIPTEMGNQPYWRNKELEGAIRRANRAADKASITETVTNPEKKAAVEKETGVDITPDPTLTPDANEAMTRFLNVARRKQGGHIDLTAMTGIGFRDLVEGMKKASERLWQTVPLSFKDQFNNAFLVDQSGVPNMLAHGTRGEFKEYNAQHGSDASGLIHFGTIDSATIINDRNITQSRTIEYAGSTGMREKFTFPSFQDFLLEKAKGDVDKVLHMTGGELKEAREDWYDARMAMYEHIQEKDIKNTEKAVSNIETSIRKLGTAKVLELFTAYQENKKFDPLAFANLTEVQQKAFTKLLDNMIAANISVRDLARVVSNGMESTVRALRNEVEGVEAKYRDHWNSPVPIKQNIRPLWSSIKNPIFVPDLGSWGTVEKLINAILHRDHIDNPLWGRGGEGFEPLGATKLFADKQTYNKFSNELLSIYKDVEKVDKYDPKYEEGRTKLYKTLEQYGFDGFVYENTVERIAPGALNYSTSASVKTKDRPPVFSVAVWDTSHIHDWADIPRSPDAVPKSQRGSINVKEILDGLENLKDIKWWGKVLPVTENQREKILDNPIVSAVYANTREYANEGDARLNHYKTYLEGLDDMMVKTRKNALQMFKVLADIQDPSLKEQRQFAQDTNTREAFLKEMGMPEESIPMAIKILNVLQHLGKTDQDNAVTAFGHNWHLEPMYFPREHTGAFTVSVVDATGTPVYMRGFEDSALAHKYKEAMAKELQGTDHQVALERNQTGSLAEVYTMLRMSDSKIPDFLKGINDKLLKELEVAKRKFEMERSAEKVAGYTGETIYGENATGAFKRSDDKLLTLLQRRMEQSYRLEVNAKLLKELKEPLIDSGALNNHPNLENYIHQFLARELGISISKFHAAGKGVDFIVDNIGKHVDAFMGEMKGYEGGDVSYFRPNAVARLAQAYTGLMSMFKLALSPSTIIANTSTWFMAPLEGFRVASKEGVDQSVAMAAMFKHYMADHDRSFQAFMKDAKIEQMVDPNVSDPMIIARTKEANRIAKAINAPRDFVELQTNKAALSYFYQYYKLTSPELEVTSREFKQLVYDATRSWTGDYTSAATPMFISQGGEAGRLMSNFAKWKFNQLGRLFDDIKDMKQGNVVPFMYTMLMTTFLAGAAGAPVIAEYEAIRRIGMKLGWWDLPPLSGALYQVKDKVEKEFGKGWAKVADAAIRSPVTVGLDEGFKAIGLESGPDLSSNLRFSSLLEVNTLPVQFMEDFYKALSATGKAIAKPLGVGHGNSAQEVKDALKFLPTGPGNVVEELYKNYLSSGKLTEGVKKQDGSTRYIDQFSSKDQGMYAQTPEEKAMSFVGTKSAKQNEYTDRLYFKEWHERYEKQQMTKLTNQFIENLREPSQMQDIAKEMAQLKGPAGIEHLKQEVQKRIVDRKTSYFEREAIKESNNPDIFAAQKALRMLEKMSPTKH